MRGRNRSFGSDVDDPAGPVDESTGLDIDHDIDHVIDHATDVVERARRDDPGRSDL